MTTMRRLIFAFTAIVLPFMALALDYSDYSERYADAPFNTAEQAGINLLTAIGAVEGNPDGTFQPDRTLNRAEFLKIVLASHPNIRATASDAEGCFPDVARDAWYSRYVCLAKKRGVIGGYPDGTFKPAQPVNYAEALKMLSELYEYDVEPGAVWYMGYAQAAAEHDTALPSNLPYDHFLTRGQMARLAAAFRAEAAGELALYRRAEAGEVIDGSSSSPLSSSVSSSSAGANASLSSSASSASMPAAFTAPTTSHQLLVGTQPLVAIADGTFTTTLANATIRLVRVELEDDVDSLQSLRLVDSAGHEIGSLEEDKYDNQGQHVWEGSFDASGAYLLPQNEPVLLCLQPVLNAIGNGGKAAELLQVGQFNVTVTGGDGTQSQQVIPTALHDPMHQTVIGTIGLIQNVAGATGALVPGNHRLLAAFSFTGSSLGSAQPAISMLLLEHQIPPGVTINNFAVARRGAIASHPCAFSTAERRFECVGIPADIGRLPATEVTVLELYGDLAVSNLGSDRTLQFSLGNAGAIGVNGAVGWSDGSQTYNWLDRSSPLAAGPRYTITP